MQLAQASRTKRRFVETLSAREMTALSLASEGLINREIANRMEVSEDCVKFHLKNVYGKLQARGRVHAIVIASSAGLLRRQDYSHSAEVAVS